jgi:peptidoglycan biosynthesis protein MviN/MurJ (putative lipid II flippase)
VALPLSISLVALLNLFQLALALSRRLGSISSGTDFPAFFLKMILLTALFSGVLALVHWGIGRRIQGMAALAVYLALAVPAMSGLYFWLAYRLGFDEMDHLVSGLKRKLRRAAAEDGENAGL